MAKFESAVVVLTESEIVAALPEASIDVTSVAAAFANQEGTDSNISVGLDASDQTVNDDVILGIVGAPFDGGGFVVSAASPLNDDGVESIKFTILAT